MMAKVFNDGGKVRPHIHWIPFIGPPVPANKGKRVATMKATTRTTSLTAASVLL
jgi:hypothetical protein